MPVAEGVVLMDAGRFYNSLPSLPPEASARAAGLRYVADTAPGIGRRRTGKAFRYVLPEGGTVRDAGTLARIRSLAIPPAWEQVWICASDDGHIQATGRDARGRKQYRYHRRWREVRDETKYGRMIAFARALPKIRRRVSRDLALPGLPREKVLATVVRLLEATFIRVGNEEYARENESFGLTTLRGRQVRVRGAKLVFAFRGKSGVEHRISFADRRLARIVRRMQDLPGEILFQYEGDDGETRAVESSDVNDYLREAAGDGFTSKDFRTWAGTLLCAQELRFTEEKGKKGVNLAVEAVATKLGNTKAVCRKCYIHPAVIDAFLEGDLRDAMAGKSPEAGVVAVLQQALKREVRKARRSGAHGSLEPLLARSLKRAERARALL